MNMNFKKGYIYLGIVTILALGFWGFTNAVSDEIFGCVAKGGVLRIIGVANKEKCNKNETPISWNKLGQQGRQGEQGIPGQDGQSRVLTGDDFYFVETPIMSVNRGSGLNTAVGCNDENDVAFAGGPEFITGGTLNWSTIYSRPDVSKYTWVVGVALSTEASEPSANMVLRAMCLRVGVD